MVPPHGLKTQGCEKRRVAPALTSILEQAQATKHAIHAIMRPELKRVGQSGQISIGRQLAGKLLRLEQLEDGRLLLTPVVDVPESQLWTLREPDKSRIERGLAWAAATPAKETAVAAIVAKAKRREQEREFEHGRPRVRGLCSR